MKAKYHLSPGQDYQKIVKYRITIIRPINIFNFLYNLHRSITIRWLE